MKKSIELILLIFTLSPCLFSCKRDSDKNINAEFIVKNAVIWTGNPLQSEAQALAVKGDSIIFVGDNQGVELFVGIHTQVLDAGGKMVIPGFIDCHVHLHEGGFDLTSVSLRDATTKQLFIQRIADFAKTIPKGTWITGGNWDHISWGGELPQASWIDSVTPYHPVVIRRLDGHMTLGNTLAMKIAHLHSATKEVNGGFIIRDAKGNPTGIVKDNAQEILLHVIPSPSEETKDQAMLLAMKFIISKGVSSVHNMGTWDDVASLRRLNKAGKMQLRVYTSVPLHTWKRLADEVSLQGKGNDWLHIGGLKGFVDGSLGSHTAAMLDPYLDSPNDKGLLLTPLDSIYFFTSQADKKGLQVMIHAIGDRAIREQLNIFERIIKENGLRDRRFRIEHAQHIAPLDIQRFAELKIISSMQPYHVIDDGRWAEKLIGKEHCKTSYAYKSLGDAGAKIAFGSDWFVAPISPLEGIYAAVTRRTLDGKNPNGWYPVQKITVEQALTYYTIHGAYASFEEDKKGSLEVGKLADFVLLSDDIRKIPPDKIPETKIMMTVIGGKIMFDINHDDHQP